MISLKDPVYFLFFVRYMEYALFSCLPWLPDSPEPNLVFSYISSINLMLVYLCSLPSSIGFRISLLISVSLRVDFILSYYRLSTTWGWNHDCWQLLALIFPAPSTRRRGSLEESWEGLWLTCPGSCSHHALAGVGRVLCWQPSLDLIVGVRGKSSFPHAGGWV